MINNLLHHNICVTVWNIFLKLNAALFILKLLVNIKVVLLSCLVTIRTRFQLTVYDKNARLHRTVLNRHRIQEFPGDAVSLTLQLDGNPRLHDNGLTNISPKNFVSSAVLSQHQGPVLFETNNLNDYFIKRDWDHKSSQIEFIYGNG